MKDHYEEYEKAGVMPGHKITVEMPYIGASLSINHYKYKYYTKPETKEWMIELQWKIKPSHIEDWELPLVVTCDGRFKDKRSTPDLHNLSKVILDSIEEVTGVNDRNMKWRCGEVTCGEPTLFITIEEG